MTRRGRRHLTALGACAIVAGLAAAVPAAAQEKGPFVWSAKRESCGVVGKDPSLIRATTRWKTSPANGYTRLTFTRQILDESTGDWNTVQRQRRSTRNTALEGETGSIHWTQWFFPFADEGGAKSRHFVVFEWFRDVAGDDPRSLKRERAFKPCRVHP